MNPYLSAAVCTLLAIVGFGAARWSASRGRRAALWHAIAALGLIVLTVITWRFNRLQFIPPLAWLTQGNTERWIMAACIPWTLGTLSIHVNPLRLRMLLKLMAWAAVLRIAIIPGIAPAFYRAEHLRAVTRFDRDGVCLQSTFYSCGPASAVTVLRRLGFQDAEEGKLCVALGTTVYTGTPADVLAATLRREYGPRGLHVSCQYADSIDALRGADAAIAIVRFSNALDHAVAVLGFEDDQIILGDPLCGWRRIPIEEFETEWRHVAILLNLTESRK